MITRWPKASTGCSKRKSVLCFHRKRSFGSLSSRTKKLSHKTGAVQFSLIKLFEFMKIMLKMVVLLVIFAYLIKQYAPSFSHLPQAEVMAGLSVTATMAEWMLSILLLVTLIFAVADYAMQNYQQIKQLMMSREDIKQEYTNTEGNPEIRQRQREIHREVQSGSLADRVSRSSVVVKNPTHIAVCIRYERGSTPLPQITESGKGLKAVRILALARKADIPVVENLRVARLLWRATQPGDYIPEHLFLLSSQNY